MAFEADESESIPKFYAGRHIFVTGGSGFLGKVLVEKMLRSCPDVAGLHLLLRAKKGVSPKDRLKSITEVPLFDVLRKERKDNWEKKLYVISGDISLPGLGICAEDRNFLVKNVSVVLHGAATVRFNDPLARAVLLNVRGTRDVCLLAKEMPNLAVFLHISTTYCNSDRLEVEEKLYPAHGDWRAFISAAEKCHPFILDALSSKLTGKLPNTYTFSKSLAEHCVNDVLKGKAVVIVRPSIVISTFMEPIKGWIDNFLGPAGLFAAMAKGIMHIGYARLDTILDSIPADVVVKYILIAAFKHAVNSVETPVPVYNCCNGDIKRVTMSEIQDMCKRVNPKYPPNNTLSLAFIIRTSSDTGLLIGTIFLHMIPAFLVDGALRLKGQKPRLWKIQRKVFTAQNALKHFMLNSWCFKNSKRDNLISAIPQDDIEEFRIDYPEIDLYQYTVNAAIGARRYLFKESDDTLEGARRHQKRLLLLNGILFYFLMVFLVYIIPISSILALPFRLYKWLFD